jgi:hypothetical protein
VRRRRLLATLGAAGLGAAAGCVAPRIADRPCPPVATDADRHVCSHTGTAGGLSIAVSDPVRPPARESLEDVRVRIANRTGAPVTIAPRDWRVFRNAGRGWRERDPGLADPTTETVPEGGSVSWSGLDALWGVGAAGPTPRGLYAGVVRAGAGDAVVDLVALVRVRARTGGRAVSPGSAARARRPGRAR